METAYPIVERTVKCSFNNDAKLAGRSATYKLKIHLDGSDEQIHELACRSLAIIDQRARGKFNTEEEFMDTIDGSTREIHASDLGARVTATPREQVRRAIPKLTREERLALIEELNNMD